MAFENIIFPPNRLFKDSLKTKNILFFKKYQVKMKQQNLETKGH